MFETPTVHRSVVKTSESEAVDIQVSLFYFQISISRELKPYQAFTILQTISPV